MTAVLADATNLGLVRMAWSSGIFSHTQLLWTAESALRDETYQAALACLVDAIHAQSFIALWGDGEIPPPTGSSSGLAATVRPAPITAPTTGREPGIKF